MNEDQLSALRAHVVALLQGRGAHLDVASVFREVANQDWSAKPGSAPHSLWQLLEHMRIALHDLLVFCTEKTYIALKWPDDYWPATAAPDSAEAARQALAALQADTEAMIALVENPKTDLFAAIPWGDGQTILREALLAADHTSYHAGQAMFLRRQLEG